MSEDVLERARDYTVTMGDHWKNGEVHDLVCDLAAEVRALRKDRERLDWLETEMDREQAAIAAGLPMPRSLFRSNTTIRRIYIDAAIAAAKGED